MTEVEQIHLSHPMRAALNEWTGREGFVSYVDWSAAEGGRLVCSLYGNAPARILVYVANDGSSAVVKDRSGPDLALTTATAKTPRGLKRLLNKALQRAQRK